MDPTFRVLHYSECWTLIPAARGPAFTIQITISILYYPHELENHQDTKLLNCKHFRRQFAIFYHNRNICTSLIVANKHTEPASRFVTLILVKSLLSQFLNIICSLFIQFSSAGTKTRQIKQPSRMHGKRGNQNYQRECKAHQKLPKRGTKLINEDVIKGKNGKIKEKFPTSHMPMVGRNLKHFE